MNLVEKLLKIDKAEFEKIETKEIASKSLAKLFGTEEDAKVRVKAIDGDLFVELSATALDKNGDMKIGEAFSTNAKIVAAGIVEPDLKDEALLKHLGTPTAAEAAKKIFKGEVNKIPTVISEISGFSDDEEDEKEIKN